MAFAISYGVGAIAFLALIALMSVKRPPKGRGIAVFFACIATAVWLLAAAIQNWWFPSAAHALESVSFAAWVCLLTYMIGGAEGGLPYSPQIRILIVLAPAAAGVCLLNDLRLLIPSASAAAFSASQVMARVAVAVCGILLVENFFRNTPPARRWHVFPFCLAIGAGFAYNLFVFCEIVVLKNPDTSLLAARGFVWASIVPLLALSMARNVEWQVDVHVSRKVVFHGATLTAAGVFLLLAAGVATQIGRLPGEWGGVSKVLFLSGSVVLLSIVLSTGSLRSRAQRFISENFYSARYDYRVEWLRSIATLSAKTQSEPLSIRAIRVVADVVNSPGGILWLEGGDGVYSIAETLNVATGRTLLELASGAFVTGFRGGTVIQEIGTQPGAPAWAGDLWLGVPLLRMESLIGFVVLSRPRAKESLSWEARDLLLALGRQIAAFIAEERAARALIESRALIDYSKRFSFIAHDVKNVAGQLSLAVRNIARFGDDAEFRTDLVGSLTNSIDKLNKLLARLRPEKCDPEEPRRVDPARIIRKVIEEMDSENIAVHLKPSAQVAAAVFIAPSTLQAAISHLVRNAVEASEPGMQVTIDVRCQRGNVVIEIADSGRGMTPEFMQNKLFAPALSTKGRGHGIGAYQARELARSAGGEVQVVSEVGAGTRISIILPGIPEADNSIGVAQAAAL